jgi:hypothetical protein
MIEIRKVDPERIPPTPAGDHSARVSVERRPQERQPDDSGKRQPPPEDEPTPAEESAGAPSIQTYDPEGHVEDHDLPGSQPRRIDFTA